MRGRKSGKRKADAAPPVAEVGRRRSAIPKAAGPRPASPNPKLGAETRKRLAKHYASKYQTMRRG